MRLGLDERSLAALRDSKAVARLGENLGDLRSEVTREAAACCAALADHAAGLRAFPPLVADVLCGPLLKLCALPHKVMSDQGHAAASAVFASAPSHRLAGRLAEQLLDKNAPKQMRARCAEYLRDALACWPLDGVLLHPSLDPTLERVLLAGVADASPDVRLSPRRGGRLQGSGPPALARRQRGFGGGGESGGRPRGVDPPPPPPQVRRVTRASFDSFKELFPARAAELLGRMDAAGAEAGGGRRPPPSPFAAGRSRSRPQPPSPPPPPHAFARAPFLPASSECGRLSRAAAVRGWLSSLH